MPAPTKTRPTSSTVFPQYEVEAFCAAIRSFNSSFEADLHAFFRLKRNGLLDLSPDAVELLDSLEELVFAGGKRLRPALIRAAFQACGGTDSDRVRPLSMAVELLHTYLLIHDDIMDHAALRRGRPTIHTHFREEHLRRRWHGDAASYGTATAILAGDLAHTYALDCFFSASDILTELVQTFFSMEEEVIVGQHLELKFAHLREAEEERLGEVLRLKSGRYSVERPLELGALLADASPDQLDSLRAFGTAVGEAFQLQDDLLGLFGDPDAVGKPVGSDLREGKFTFLIYYALKLTRLSERDLIEEALGNPDLSTDAASEVCELIRQCGALERVRERIESNLIQARTALSESAFTPEGHAFLINLTYYLQSRQQ